MLATAGSALAGPTLPMDWTGFYVGGHVGYDWGDVHVQDVDAYNGPPQINYDVDGYNFGIHAGYNWQIDPDWMVGLEGEVGDLHFEDSQQYGPYIGVRLPTDSRASVRAGAYWALSARVGFTWDEWLFYLKGGWSRTRMSVSFIDTDPTGVILVSGTSNAGYRTVYPWGGGIERAIDDHISIRAEYLHIDFNTISHTAIDSGASSNRFRHDVEVNTVRFGVSYRW